MCIGQLCSTLLLLLLSLFPFLAVWPPIYAPTPIRPTLYSFERLPSPDRARLSSSSLARRAFLSAIFGPWLAA